VRLRFLFALAAFSVAPFAEAEIDRQFGTDGSVRLGFQPQHAAPDADSDWAIAACGRNGGPLMVVGLASGRRRIVTAWLTAAGELDVRYSVDGKESFTLHQGESRIFVPIGACLPDGDVLLAYEVAPATFPVELADGAVHLRRIDADSGLPDPGFGDNGLLVLDLDSHATSPLAAEETPRGLNPGLEGEWLLTGSYEVPGPAESSTRFRSWVARIGASGDLRRVALLGEQEPDLRRAMAAMPADDGSLWVAARRHVDGEPDALDVLRLDPVSLASMTPRLRGFGDFVFVERGTRLPDGSFALAGLSRSNGAPVVIRVDASRVDALTLPRPDGALRVDGGQVAFLPGGDLFFAGRAMNSSGQGYAAYYARIGNTGAGLRPVASFGSGGSLLRQEGGGPGCTATTPRQEMYRFTFWNGQPTSVGLINVSCNPDDPDNDYHVLRLKQPLLRHGFE
jgi:hypothetical protein